jgi:hypothetical protein
MSQMVFLRFRHADPENTLGRQNVQGAVVQISLPAVKRESGARADNLPRNSAAAPATVSE